MTKPNTFKFLVAVTTLCIVTQLAHAVDNKREWDAAFRKLYGDSVPMLDLTNGNDAGLFAWHAHFWIRAHLSMAQTFGDTTYLDRCVELIDHILYYRDDARQARGELNLQKQPYVSAPLHYLNHRDEAAPGWRVLVFDKEWRVQTLDDGQITHAMMRFVDLVENDARFSFYRSKAAYYLARVEETVKAHNSLFAFDRFPDVPGSYYYPDPDGTRLWSGGVPFNQSATMGVTLLLLDKVKGGVPEYRQKARALLDYFRLHLRKMPNGACDWDYHLHDPSVLSSAGVSDQDFNHAHIDLSFLILAYHRGLGLSREEMQSFANTLTRSIYRGDGELAWSVDGRASDAKKRYWSVAFDWIDLAEFDSGVLNIAVEVYKKHYQEPSWAQPFLGWAEILRWQSGGHQSESSGR